MQIWENLKQNYDTDLFKYVKLQIRHIPNPPTLFNHLLIFDRSSEMERGEDKLQATPKES